MLGKIVTITRLPFTTTVDASTVAARSRQRYERVARTAISALGAKAISVATGLISVPLTLSYLGKERFGLWMTLTSFVAFLSFADMGVGIGLQNGISKYDGQGQKTAVRGLVASALSVTVGMFVLLCMVALFGLPLISWSDILKTHDPAAQRDLLPTAQAVVMAFGLGLPCYLMQRILHGLQRGYWANAVLAIGNALALAGVILCIWQRLPLYILAGVVMGTPPLVSAGAGCLLFVRCPWLRPSIGAISLRDMANVTRVGIAALAAQVAYTIMVSGPAIVIAGCLGTGTVAPFSVTQKMLGVAGILMTMAIGPLWPAYGEAAAKGDVAWVTKAFRRSIWLGAAIAVPVFTVVTIVGQQVIAIWTRQPSVVPDWSLLMACNVWSFLNVWNSIASIFLNGLNRFIGQATYGVLFAVVALLLSFRYGSQLGAAGVVWLGILVGMVPRCIFQVGEVVIVLGRLRRSFRCLEMRTTTHERSFTEKAQ